MPENPAFPESIGAAERLPGRRLRMAAATSARAREGAHKVLSHCLHLSPGDTLAIYFDEPPEPTAEILID